MATIAQLIGLDSSSPSTTASNALTALSSHSHPDDFPHLAHLAKAALAQQGHDVRGAYADALEDKARDEKEQDRQFLERAREFVELNEQVETSTQLLSSLSSFLSTFQSDLSAVSGHISELQGRSKTIEGRLGARKAVERSLHPFITSIALPPSLISTIIDTDPSSNTDAWIPAVRELDAKLGAIRGGARVESRRSLDDAAEGLRVAASSKILAHLVSLLRPYTLSLSLPLPSLHSSLLRLKPLFDFLRRHAARQAHEFQKAYVATVRWVLETGFRRYVRALEAVRGRSAAAGVGGGGELIGSTSGGTDSLALLNSRKSPSLSSSTSTPSLSSSTSTPSLSSFGGFSSGARAGAPTPSPASAASVFSAATQSALDNAQVEGPGIILAHMAADKSFKPPPESLFRSLSLVLADNASSEYAFLSAFFGQHSSLDLPAASSSSSLAGAASRAPGLETIRSEGEGGGRTTRGTSEASDSFSGRPLPPRAAAAPAAAAAAPQSESGKTVTSVAAREREKVEREKDERAQRAVVDGLWKGVMEPALEYARNFTHALLPPSAPASAAPAALGLLAMIKLNDALLSSLCPSSTANAASSSSPAAAGGAEGQKAPAEEQGVNDDEKEQMERSKDSGTSSGPTCPSLEAYLTSTRLLLFPLFAQLMSSHADSLRKINGSPAPPSSTSSGMLGGMFGGGGGGGAGASVKDSVVEMVVRRYAEMVAGVVALSEAAQEAGAAEGGQAAVEQDEEMVFSSLLRIRNELDKLLLHQASKISSPDKQRAFLRSHYEELLRGLSAGLSRHARMQAEVAHYRELARKAS
ncbi:hypothetical protein JCM6882_009491 [Rhodosporidiobolus microsporus]